MIASTEAAPLRRRPPLAIPGLITLADVFGDPAAVAKQLPREVVGLDACELRSADRQFVIYWLTLRPWTPMLDAGYPIERVGILVHWAGELLAVPHDAYERRWRHLSDLSLFTLCLWYPDDPRALRWEWSDGFAAYVGSVHRHLMAEEYARRHGVWPSEEAPHGTGAVPHAIKSAALRERAQR